MATIVRRRGRYLARIRLSKLKPVSKMFDTRQGAKKWAAEQEHELRAHLERESERRDVATLTLRGLIDEYLEDSETKARRSFDDMALRLAWFVNKHGSVRVMEFGALRLRDARKQLEAGRSPATVNRYLSCMRSCWNWGRAAGIIPQAHLWPTRLMLKEPRGRTRYLSDAEIQAVLKAAEADPVMEAVILVAIGTGLRRGELLALRWSDIDLAGAKLTVRHSKNERPRTVHLPANVVAALKRLKDAPVVGISVFLNRDGKPLRASLLNNRWRAISKAAALTDFHFHDFRHTFATTQIQNGTPLHELKEMLGHSSLNMVMRYAHLLQGKEQPGHKALEAKLTKKGHDAN